METLSASSRVYPKSNDRRSRDQYTVVWNPSIANRKHVLAMRRCLEIIDRHAKRNQMFASVLFFSLQCCFVVVVARSLLSPVNKSLECCRWLFVEPMASFNLDRVTLCVCTADNTSSNNSDQFIDTTGQNDVVDEQCWSDPTLDRSVSPEEVQEASRPGSTDLLWTIIRFPFECHSKTSVDSLGRCSTVRLLHR